MSRSFHGDGGNSEHILTVRPPETLDFEGQLAWVQDRYKTMLRRLQIEMTTAVFRRVFLSDTMNQATLTRASALFEDLTATSIVQQPPLSGAKIELLAYHIDSPTPLAKRRLSPNHLLVETKDQRHLRSTQLCTCDHHSVTLYAVSAYERDLRY